MPEPSTSQIPQQRPTVWLSAAALLCVAAALTGFGVLLDEGLWGPSALLVAAAAVASGAIARATLRHVRRLVVTVTALGTSLIGGLIALTVVFAADTAVFGVVPVPSTLQRFSELIAAGELSIVQQSIPAAADDGIRFLLASGVAVFAVLIDAVATMSRRPALAAIPLLGMLAVPVILAPGGLPLLSVIATSAAFLLLLALHRPAASGGVSAAGRAVAAAAAVLVTALVLPPLLPSVVAGAAPSGSGPVGLITGINPSLTLGNDLRRSNPVTALRYSTDTGGGVYLTLSHLAEFDERSVQPVLATRETAAEQIGPPAWLGAEVATTAASTRIRLEGVRTRWVPLPSAPIGIGGLGSEWLVNDAGITLSTVEGTLRNAEYVVDSLVAEPTPEQLRAATVDAAGLDVFRGVPAGIDPVIASTAREVADAALGDAPYDQALALQRFFTSGDFEYSESAPVELGYDGTSADIVAVFLEVRSGYCVHYAAAMALMARTLGIPSRIAVGFLPGARNPDVPNEFVVSTDDLHAWPELHFDDVGWVRFEPTPSRGAVPDYASADIAPPDIESLIDPETGEVIEPSPVEPEAPEPVDPVDRVTGPTDAPDASELIGPGATGTPGEADTGAALNGGRDARLLSTLISGLLVVLVVAPGLWRAVRRGARLRSPDALEHWREVRDTARDLGLPADPESTPRQLAAVWAREWSSGDRERLERVRSALESRAFDRGSTVAESDDARALLPALRRSAPWWWRVLALIAPTSLLERAPRDERLVVEGVSSGAPPSAS